MSNLKNSEKEVKLKKFVMKSIRFNESEIPLAELWNKDFVKEIKNLLRIKLSQKTPIEKIISSEIPNFKKISQLREIKKDLFLKLRNFHRWDASEKQIELIEKEISLIYNEISMLKGLNLSLNTKKS